MRNVPPFSCPACGTSSPKQQRCAGCGGVVVDANGIAPLAKRQVRDGALGVVGSLRTWFADRAARHEVAHRREAGGRLRAIVDVTDGTVRIRGRVRILRMVRAPDGAIVAAFRTRRIGRPGGSSVPPPSPTGQPMRRWVEEATACGAFLVDDGSGLALVDDDAVDLEALDVAPLPAGKDGTLALREGDVVEVIGPASWSPPPPDIVDARLTGTKAVLRFDGRPDARVLLLPLPLTAVLPIARFRSVHPSVPGSPATREHEALSEMEAAGRAGEESRGGYTGRG